MPNPRGVNQYSKGGRSGRKKTTAKSLTKKIASSRGFSLDKGTSSAAHAAFVASRLAASKKKKRR